MHKRSMFLKMTYVNGGTAASKATNYGTEVEAFTKYTTTTAARIAYFKFPLTSVIASSVATAKIKFFTYLPSSSSVTEILQIHKMPKMMGDVANTWSETTVTYNDKLRIVVNPIGDVTISSVPTFSPNDYSNSYELDVTAYFNEALPAVDTGISFAIKGMPSNAGALD